MEEGRMTRAIAIQAGITGRDATLIKAVVDGIMPEISDMLSSATVPLIVGNKSLRDENADLAKRIAALEHRELTSLAGYVRDRKTGVTGRRGAVGDEFGWCSPLNK